MRFHVEVTDEDIARGVRESTVSCPIARALLRSPNVGEVAVDSVTEIRMIGGDQLSGSLPEEAQRFMEQFDDGETVSPFAFDLEAEASDDDDDSEDGP